MQKSDLERFSIAMIGLAEIFAEPISDARMRAYFSALDDLAIDQVESAVKSLMRSAKFFPKPAEFREVVEGSSDDRAAQAWQLLVQAIGKGGPYASLHVDDPALADAILKTFGGWIEACNRLPVPGDPMFASLQKQFSGYYRMASRNSSGVLRYFPGIHEANNRQSIGTWERSIGGFSQPVTVINAGQVFKRNLEFDGTTGALTESSRKALESGLRPLPPATAPKSLPAPNTAQELASPEEIAQVKLAIARLAGKKAMPGGD